MDLLVRDPWQARGLSCAVRSWRQAFIFWFSSQQTQTIIPRNVCQTHLLKESWSCETWQFFANLPSGRISKQLKTPLTYVGCTSLLPHRPPDDSKLPGRFGYFFTVSFVFVDTEAIRARGSFSLQMTTSDLACEQHTSLVSILVQAEWMYQLLHLNAKQ